jgi:hypothetical protein
MLFDYLHKQREDNDMKAVKTQDQTYAGANG